jgi:hypothetical protein
MYKIQARLCYLYVHWAAATIDELELRKVIYMMPR